VAFVGIDKFSEIYITQMGHIHN